MVGWSSAATGGEVMVEDLVVSLACDAHAGAAGLRMRGVGDGSVGVVGVGLSLN
jgi:hypothetical protein